MACADDMVPFANDLSSLDKILEKFINNIHSLYLKLNTNNIKFVIFVKKID